MCMAPCVVLLVLCPAVLPGPARVSGPSAAAPPGGVGPLIHTASPPARGSTPEAAAATRGLSQHSRGQLYSTIVGYILIGCTCKYNLPDPGWQAAGAAQQSFHCTDLSINVTRLPGTAPHHCPNIMFNIIKHQTLLKPANLQTLLNLASHL